MRSLDKTVFDATSDSLRKIDLSNNQLSVLPRSLFKRNRNLESLILANNTLTELPDILFDELPLKELDLSGNFLTSISSRLLSRLNSLQHLDLSQNEIENLHGQALSGLNNLQYLRLDNNRISKICKYYYFLLHICSWKGENLRSSFFSQFSKRPLEVMCDHSNTGVVRQCNYAVVCPNVCQFSLSFASWPR